MFIFYSIIEPMKKIVYVTDNKMHFQSELRFLPFLPLFSKAMATLGPHRVKTERKS